MKYTEELDKVGNLVVMIYFSLDHYKENIQNETRRFLKKTLVNEAKKNGVILEPWLFSLIRDVEDVKTEKSAERKSKSRRTRAVGAMYFYKYKVENQKNINVLFDILERKVNQTDYHNSFRILYLDFVGVL